MAGTRAYHRVHVVAVWVAIEFCVPSVPRSGWKPWRAPRDAVLLLLQQKQINRDLLKRARRRPASVNGGPTAERATASIVAFLLRLTSFARLY